MPENKGSAYLMVIGVISVLILIVLGFFRSNVSRRFSTRLMSNEKRAETLAESAIELVLRDLKDKMNPNLDTGEVDENIYPFFRVPLRMTTNHMGSANGTSDIPLAVAGHPAWEYPDPGVPGLAPIKSLIDELGEDNVPTLKVTCEIIKAEAFSAKVPNYQVAGVSVPHATAIGQEAKFLDKITTSATGNGSIGDWLGILTFGFLLPNHQGYDKCKISLPWPFSGDVELWNPSPTLIKIEIDIADLFTLKPDPIDIEETIKKYVDFGGGSISMDSVVNLAMPGLNRNISLTAGGLKTAIQNAYNDLPTLIKNAINSFSGDYFSSGTSGAAVVEKGGVLRLTAEVVYLPNGPGGPSIERKLVAHRQFKVSDMQPPAPEYSFFVANSDILNESFNWGLPKTINWRDPLAIASVTIHNIPGGNYNNCGGLTGGGSGSNQVPGMVRINSANTMEINTFLGTQLEPKMTEYNALLKRPQRDTPFNLIPTAYWNGKRGPYNHNYHVDFPVVRHGSPFNKTFIGCESLKTILDFCDALDCPVLLFGMSHIEYPLGLELEAKMRAKRGNVKIDIKPKGNAGGDRTKVKIAYENLPSKYGLPDPSNPSVDTSLWKTNDYKWMPANLYSTLQYAKKATLFYESEGEFWGDKKVVESNNLECNGVIFIKGGLTINKGSNGEKLRVKGRGLLVVQGNVVINTDILRNGDAVFGLIARDGAVSINSGCSKIEASVYSNACIKNSAGNKAVIDGNLVVNEFDRGDVASLEVQYNGNAVRMSSLAVMRDVGKFDPKRYYVSLGQRWTHFEFAKY